MYRQRMLSIALFVMANHVSGADPAALLARVADAFDRNAERERYWTWTSKEIWQIADRTGKVLQPFPSVTIESAIKRDGTRCNAVVAWSDGLPPHLLHSDADSRCDATVSSDSVKFNVTELLKARDVKIASDSPERVILAIAPDPDRARSSDHQVSCAASIRATLLVDPTTFFPRRIEGEVTGDGCDQRSPAPPTYYGDKTDAGTVSDTFRKGSSFWLEYQLQQDRFGGPDRRAWLLTHWHYDMRGDWSRGDLLFYWGREMEYGSRSRGQRIIVDCNVTAQQFGAESKIVQ